MRNTVKKSEFTGLTKKVDVNDVPAYFRTNKYFAGFLAKMTEGDELWNMMTSGSFVEAPVTSSSVATRSCTKFRQ